MNKPNHLRLALVAISLVCLPSCGTAFRKAWNHAPASQGVEGKWEGTWLSAVNGHTGTLKCVVSAPTGKGDHEFFYRATWKKILSGSYKAVHHVEKKSGSHVFKGDHQMPDWAGGKYHYEGTVKGDEFSACYESAMDRGSYMMRRVK
ncbi:MAG: hypothetical protein RIS79_3017 [Verrucomicrobiota bacterium]